jgi:TIR domain-containing protein
MSVPAGRTYLWLLRLRCRLFDTGILCDFPPCSLLFFKGAVGTLHERTPSLFISHASPEDNAFTIWLGAKLAAAGYEVWADVLRLTGGDDWQRKLEDALRNRACEVLVVTNQKSVDKQGVRNEIQIASDAAKKIGDKRRFIIPLKPGPFDAPFLSPAVCALRAKRYRACPIYRFQ